MSPRLLLALLALAFPPEAARSDPLEAELARVAGAVERYSDQDVAKAEGWRPFGGDEPLMGRHWNHPDGPDHVSGLPLDLTRPSNLIYTEIGGRMVLTGVAYVVRLAPGEPLPEGFAGASDRWHVHDAEAAIEAATEERPILRWLARGWLDRHWRAEGDGRTRLAMVHVWTGVENPDGVFADHNRRLPFLKLGLPVEWAEGVSLGTARGVNLATRDGCEDALGGRLWVAGTGWRDRRRLMAACEHEAAGVRAALDGGRKALIERAGVAWSEIERLLDETLTPEEKRRIDAMVEHRHDAAGLSRQLPGSGREMTGAGGHAH